MSGLNNRRRPGRPRKNPVIEPDEVETIVYNQSDLPHLNGFKHYKWSKEFFDDESRNCFLVASNQCGKSVALIRKTIDLATNEERWMRIWGHKPTCFWYFLPSRGVATVEFQEKWVKEVLPKASMKNHPIYGWQEKYQYQQIHSITFNTGVTIYFKSYEMSEANLQASSVYFIASDEELPANLWDEINMRRDAVDGLFNLAFTATLSQRFWWEAIECVGKQNERFKDAKKIQVSLYDCQYFVDGTPSRWSDEKIERRISECRSEKEIQRRVYGRFVLEEKEIFSAFSEKNNVYPREFKKLASYRTFVSVFVGEQNKAAFSIIYLNKTFDEAFVHFSKTTTIPLVDLVLLISKMIPDKQALKFVNNGSKEFSKIALSGGQYFEPVALPKISFAGLVNSLFVTKNLHIGKFDEQLELITQIITLKPDNFKDFTGYEMVGSMLLGLSQMLFSFSNTIEGPKEKFDMTKGMDERTIHYKGLDREQFDEDVYLGEFSEFNDIIEEFNA